MSYEERPGKGPIFQNSGKGPALNGYVIADRDIEKGEKIKLSLWENKQRRSDKSPLYNAEINRWEPKGRDEEVPF